MSAVAEDVVPRPPAISVSSPGGRLAGVGGPAPLAVAVVLVGVAFAVDPAGARPFTSLRWAVVSTGVAVAALAVGRWTLPRSHAVLWVVVIGAMSVGAMAGPDPTTAWLGHPQRHLGVFAWVVFALAAAAGAGLARSRSALATVEVVVVAVAGTLVITSAVDRLGWDPAGSSFADGRIGGVFGQPVVLASVAVLLLPVVVGARRVGGIRWPIAAGLLLVVVLTQTRGAVVGVVAVVVVTTPTWSRTVRTARPAWRRRMVGTIVAAVAVLATTPAGDRVTDVFGSSRPDEWAVALDVVAAHPLTGVGPEGYRIAVLERLDDGYVDRHGRDVVVDRAHSAPLDVTASGGLMAGAGYVALVGTVVAATWRRQRPGRGSGVAVAAGAGAVGVFAAALVSFPVPEVDAVAWIFAGVALAAPHRVDTTAAPRPRLRGLAAAAVVVAVVAGVTDVVADRRMGDALAAAHAGRTTAAVDSAVSAVDLRPDLVDAHYVAAVVAATGPTILDLDRAIDLAGTGLERFGGDPALRDLHAGLLVDRAVRSRRPDDTEAALDALAALEADDPTSLVVRSGTDRLTAACLLRCENRP